MFRETILRKEYLMNRTDICRICVEPITDDDEKIYCPDCGAPMHKDCFEMKGECPNVSKHMWFAEMRKEQAERTPGKSDRLFPDGDGCEICGKPFSENDERVYCPDCGASMHRYCYNLTHSCPYEGTHTPRPRANGRASILIPRKPVCDRCGRELDNGEEKVYCPVCGTPVHRICWDNEPSCPNEFRHDSGYDWEKEHGQPVPEPAEEPDTADNKLDPMMPITSLESFSDKILSRPIVSPQDGEELTCRGVKQAELVHFLGMHNFSTPRFFSLFMNMANSGKVVSFNISAWLFMPLYHFYRRMTGLAFILTLASFILTVPTFITQIIYMNDPGNGNFDPSLIALANITSYIMLFFRIILLLFNDYIYMRWSVSKILALRERYKDATSEEYYAALEHSGNPRMAYVLIGLGLMFTLIYFLNVFISASGFLN